MVAFSPNAHSVVYKPLAQTTGVLGFSTPTNTDAITYVPGTHTFVVPSADLEEVPGNRDFDDLINMGPLPLDMPHWKSLSGINVIIIMTMACFSLIICLGRADFNLVLYIIGYLIWCIESEPAKLAEKLDAQGRVIDEEHYQGRETGVGHSRARRCYPKTISLITGSRKTEKSVKFYVAGLTVATILDLCWVVLAYSTWICSVDNYPLNEFGAPISRSRSLCLNGPATILLYNTHTMHEVVLASSLVNCVLKIVSGIISGLWIRQQKIHRRLD